MRVAAAFFADADADLLALDREADAAPPFLPPLCAAGLPVLFPLPEPPGLFPPRIIFVDRGPRASFSLLLGHTTVLVTFCDVIGLPFLLVSVFDLSPRGMVASCESVYLGRIGSFCAELAQDGPIAALSARNEGLFDAVAFPVPKGLFRANEPTIDLHVFVSHPFDGETTFESRSHVRAIKLSEPPGSDSGLGHVIDEEARHPMLDDFRR